METRELKKQLESRITGCEAEAKQMENKILEQLASESRESIRKQEELQQ